MNLVPPTVQNAAGTALHEGIFQNILQVLYGRFFTFAIFTPFGGHSIPERGTALVVIFNVPLILPQEEFSR